MPIKIPNNLPAHQVLHSENIFVMEDDRAYHQDIRPLKIVILNLMPKKISAENQLLRLLSNTPLQVEITLIRPESHISKNTSAEHLEEFYRFFSDIENEKYDGMIITGAPVEKLEFEEVNYWKELRDIMEWSKTHVTSTLHICWASLAALNYHFNIPKYVLPEKVSGVFTHRVLVKNENLVRGFDDVFYVPHSRYTEVRREDILKVPELSLIAESEEAGVHIVMTPKGKQIFVTGHAEYDPLTLKWEYERDVAKGLPIEKPKNYFPNDDSTQEPIVRWRAHAGLLFSNWLNYYVYQETPYEL